MTTARRLTGTRHPRVLAASPDAGSTDSLEPGRVVDRIASLGIAIAVLLTALQTAAHLTNALLLDNQVFNLSAEVDGNAFTWLSSAATFAAALGALVLALFLPAVRARCLVTALLLCFLSADDVARFHETIAGRLVYEFDLPERSGGAVWPAVYLPLLALAFALLWRLADDARDAAGRSIRIGLGLLVLSVVMELLWTPWDFATRARDRWPNAVEVAFEEGVELAGWILIASGMIGLACASLVRLATVRDADNGGGRAADPNPEGRDRVGSTSG